MFHNQRVLTIVETGALEARLIEFESQRSYQVKPGTRIGTKTYDIARVGWNLWLVKNDVKHCASSPM
jgi:hypothetical protein